MKYRLAVEDIEQNHWVAWALDLPGCFSSARTPEAAVLMAPTAISRYFTWLVNHGYKNPPRRDGIEVEVVERFKSYVSNGMYVVNAFFDHDRSPLEAEEVEFGAWLLGCTREDFDDLTRDIPAEVLAKQIPGQAHGNILGIVEHVAWSEWWYFDSLDLAFPREKMPPDPFEMIARVRQHTLETLPKLVGRDQIVSRSGERWSPRKVLRRTLWHETDHTRHIEKLLAYI